MPTSSSDLSPELLLHAYANGIFPMSDGKEVDEIFWVQPQQRGIIPLDQFYISKSLAKAIRQQRYTVTLNQDFDRVIFCCADREETWINNTITMLYNSMHEMGFAHSIEIWENKTLVGGVYGVTLGRAFFGESMFSLRPNTSKIALAYLVTQLLHTGYKLLDTQFITPHLARLGGIEVPQETFLKLLDQALTNGHADIASKTLVDHHSVIQRKTQTS